MGLFGNKRAIRKIEEINAKLSHSFSNVKQDTQLIFQWLHYFQQKIQQQEERLQALDHNVDNIHVDEAEIKAIMEKYYSNEHIVKTVNEVNKRVDQLYMQQTKSDALAHGQYDHVINKLNELAKRVDEMHLNQSAIERLDRSQDKIVDHMERLKEKIQELRLPKTQVSRPVDLNPLITRLDRLEHRKTKIKEKILKKITKTSKEYIRSVILSLIKKYEKISALQLKEMIVEEQGLCSKSSFYRILEEIEQDPDIGVIKQGKEKQYLSRLAKFIDEK